MNDSVGEWLILTVTAKKLNKIIYVTPKKLINCINLFWVIYEITKKKIKIRIFRKMIKRDKKRKGERK